MKNDIEILGDDGYPTDEFLDIIEHWPHTDGYNDLLEFAMSGHIYDDYWSKGEKTDGSTIWSISTGGWSGNESILASLQFNHLFWMCCWQSSRRGGHYTFEVKNEKRAD